MSYYGSFFIDWPFTFAEPFQTKNLGRFSSREMPYTISLIICSPLFFWNLVDIRPPGLIFQRKRLRHLSLLIFKLIIFLFCFLKCLD